VGGAKALPLNEQIIRKDKISSHCGLRQRM
jgi:hypothetical protein